MLQMKKLDLEALRALSAGLIEHALGDLACPATLGWKQSLPLMSAGPKTNVPTDGVDSSVYSAATRMPRGFSPLAFESYAAASSRRISL
jgi:hypothetical protein